MANSARRRTYRRWGLDGHAQGFVRDLSVLLVGRVRRPEGGQLRSEG
jgi:hypothetical protein